jgi:hypothetical protein
MLVQQAPHFIAGTLKPSGRQTVRDKMESLRLNLNADSSSAQLNTQNLNLSKFSDPFGIEERTIDVVVDRMLKELTW